MHGASNAPIYFAVVADQGGEAWSVSTMFDTRPRTW